MRKDKLVFLDAATVNHGDIDFGPLENLGDFTAFDSTPPGLVQERAKDATVLLINKVRIDAALLEELKKLRLIALTATGHDNVDIDAAARKGIAVANVSGYSTSSVAQFTITLILSCATNVIRYNTAAHDGTWSRSPVFTLGTWPAFELRGKALGILGMGAIGGEVGRMASALGMRVVALRRGGASGGGSSERLGIREIAERSDFISIHMPLTRETRHMIDDEFFSHMKKSAFLINTSRGPIVDPAALERALRSGTIAGAAIDVMEREPPEGADPLLNAPNLIITPHVAWASVESRRRLMAETAENIAAFQRGEQRNRIDKVTD